jgi:hypothetical protein
MSIDVLPTGVRERLIATAQYNCDLSDALFAQSSSLCIYLLDMREFYRWQHRLPLTETLRREALGPWINSRERSWEALRAAAGESPLGSLRPLDPAVTGDPFDVRPVDGLLADAGLVYGAGVGRFGRPIFFLADCLRRETRDGLEVLVCGEELARGASAPPAMSRGEQIIIRSDALQRWLWTRYEEWRHHPRDNGFVTAWQLHAGGELPTTHRDPVAVVRSMTSVEIETLVLHEIGERRADEILGDPWHDMIEELDSRRTENFVRTLRDLWADCSHTLPGLIERQEAASIHCWFGLLDGLRLKFSPRLLAAYRDWCEGSRESLADAVASGERHWRGRCLGVLERWRSGGVAAVETMVGEPDIGH